MKEMQDQSASDGAVHGHGDQAELIDGHKGSTMQDEGNHREASPLQSTRHILESGKELLSDQSTSLKIIIVSTIVFALAVTIALVLTIFLAPPPVGSHAAVATDVPECSDRGLDILKMGGNAVDAAVAAALCVGVINAHSSGLGGGGFMLIHDQKVQQSTAYDFRETAPGASRQDMFGGNATSMYYSGLAVAVPGELKGLYQAHSEHGKLPWHVVVAPAIDLAASFMVTKDMAKVLRTHVQPENFPPRLRRIFYQGGKLVETGDVISRPDLVEILTLVSQQGPAALYDGPLGDSLIETVRRYGGVMTKDDLRNYEVKKPQVITTTFKDTTVATLPAPSSGPALLLLLNIVEGYNWTAANQHRAITFHQFTEASKFAYTQRLLRLADPDFITTVNASSYEMISKELASQLRNLITDNVHPAAYYGPPYQSPPNKGTSHISVIDSTELMVSLTLTLNLWFGSQIMTPEGILLNNEMADFSDPNLPSLFGVPPSPLNYPAPNKRPLSSMAPTVLYNKEHPCNLRVSLGASNGTKIITGIAETIINILSFEMRNLTDAIETPRIHNQLYPNVTEYEKGFDAAVLAQLQGMGETLEQAAEGLSAVQAVMKVNDDIQAHSDSRKSGEAALY